ncbi:ABC transporter ATP-binding protein [Saccharomonospora sp. CUA-673]|uniref:ATP-binding cassette domain-containing protein n=1 Tax=Saccharomonospora sp. CUA-673 TaxID=1904969 RepID=UPI002101320B|nr:ABC transporter ATP-binding protein [Saccharomonospora sp. CUA-673]
MITTSAFALGLLSHGATSEAAEPRLSPALLPALVALALAGISAVTDATATVTQLHPLVASAQRVVDGVDRPPVVTAPDAPQPIPDGPLGLRFRDVSFSYEDRPPTVSRWSAEIAAGEHVGMAGPSGSGKSTVVALAARLWDPSSGTIELVSRDGVAAALHRIDDAELRQAVAVVDQDATLFHGTVRDNLLLGTEGTADGPTDEELSTTLHRVGAAHWIGLDDELGQNGLRLSGGQQARLCLARASYDGPASCSSTRSPPTSTPTPNAPSPRSSPTSPVPPWSPPTARRPSADSTGGSTSGRTPRPLHPGRL